MNVRHFQIRSGLPNTCFMAAPPNSDRTASQVIKTCVAKCCASGRLTWARSTCDPSANTPSRPVRASEGCDRFRPQQGFGKCWVGTHGLTANVHKDLRRDLSCLLSGRHKAEVCGSEILSNQYLWGCSVQVINVRSVLSSTGGHELDAISGGNQKPRDIVEAICMHVNRFGSRLS